MISQVLDPENRDDFVWAHSGYAGAQYEDLLGNMQLWSQTMRRVRVAIP